MGDHWILGAGTTGHAVVAACERLGKSGSVISDAKPDADSLAWFADHGFTWSDHLPGGSPSRVILSPGFRPDHPLRVELTERAITPVPEFEWAAEHLNGDFLAVTGSLGKTTMVTLAGLLLESTGRPVAVSGNIGTPLAARVADVSWVHGDGVPIHVLELSSFQLEAMLDFRPDAAVCLNLEPNHLDWHGSFDAYATAKARLFANMRGADVGIFPDALEPFRRSAFGERPFPTVGPWRYESGRIVQEAGEGVLSLQNSLIDQPTLGRNFAMLWPALQRWLVDAERVREGLLRFSALPHRMQQLEISGELTVVNDSKSTCLAATRAAVESSEEPLHVIMGGLSKGESCDSLKEVLSEREVSGYFMGDCAEDLCRKLQDALCFGEALGTLEACVGKAVQRAQAGDTLLLSPGCASFDQFSGYEERGRRFETFVRAALDNEGGSSRRI